MGPPRVEERYELAEESRARYRGVGRVDTEELSTSFCTASGYRHEYEVKILSCASG